MSTRVLPSLSKPLYNSEHILYLNVQTGVALQFACYSNLLLLLSLAKNNVCSQTMWSFFNHILLDQTNRLAKPTVLILTVADQMAKRMPTSTTGVPSYSIWDEIMSSSCSFSHKPIRIYTANQFLAIQELSSAVSVSHTFIAS